MQFFGRASCMHLAPMHLRSGRYPHEKEILFPPLVGLEAIDKRTEGKTLVVELRLDRHVVVGGHQSLNPPRWNPTPAL